MTSVSKFKIDKFTFVLEIQLVFKYISMHIDPGLFGGKSVFRGRGTYSVWEPNTAGKYLEFQNKEDYSSNFPWNI